ncbi:hypothetical protein [Nostoc sp.]
MTTILSLWLVFVPSTQPMSDRTSSYVDGVLRAGVGVARRRHRFV